MSEQINRRLNIYIDAAGAEKALDRLTAKETELTASIEKSKKAGKDFTTQMQQLANTRQQMASIKDVLDGKVLPSLNQAESAVKRLRNELRQMPADTAAAAAKFQEFKKAEATLAQVKNQFQAVSKETRGFGSIVDTAFGVFLGGGLLGAVNSAAGSMKEFFSGSITEALQAEENTARLKATLDNIGKGDAFDRIIQKTKDVADQFKYLDNDEVTAVFEKLITYGKLTEAQMNELIPVIVDFSAKQRISVEEGTTVVIKALEGNSKALKEYGIDMKDAKTVTEAYGLLMTDLKPRVEGAAKAFGETTAGQIAITRQQIKDLKEDIGTQLLPVTQRFYQAISDTIRAVRDLTGSETLTGFQKFRVAIGFGTVDDYAKLGKEIVDKKNAANANRPAPTDPKAGILGLGGDLNLSGGDAANAAAAAKADAAIKKMQELRQKAADFTQRIEEDSLTSVDKLLGAYKKLNDAAEKDLKQLQEFVKAGIISPQRAKQLAAEIGIILDNQMKAVREKMGITLAEIPINIQSMDESIAAWGEEFGPRWKKGLADAIEKNKIDTTNRANADKTGLRGVLKYDLDQVVEWAGQVSTIFGSIASIKNTADDIALKREISANDVRRASYQRMLNGKLITQSEYDKRIAALDKKEETRRQEIALRQFKRDRAMQTTQAIMSAAQAVISTLAARPGSLDVISLGAFRAISIGIIAATTAAQIAAIASSKPPQFAEGGFVPNGPSHAAGGISLVDNRSGSKVGEVEGGEPILSRATYRQNRPLIDALLNASQSNGGRFAPSWASMSPQSMNVPRISSSINRVNFFSDGGIIPTTPGTEGGNEKLLATLNALMAKLDQPFQSYVSLNDFQTQSARLNTIRRNGMIN